MPSDIYRLTEPQILDNLTPGKVLILLGARRTGKTFILKKIKKNLTDDVLYLNGEDADVQRLLELRAAASYRQFFGDKKILLIDEAQKLNEAGKTLKLITDSFPDLRIVVTGSSAFDLTGKLGEPLTGRNLKFRLYPLSESEIVKFTDPLNLRADLEERLVFGSYPELYFINDRGRKERYLRELVNDYLLKDILAFDGIRNSGVIKNLLRLIAFQIGKEVSLNEIGTQLGISRNTVEKYLDLLSKVFVIFRLEGYSRNLRKEITKNSKWYFYDNGIRNTLIANFFPFESRPDKGELWENFIISERLKHQEYSGIFANNFFWRTYDHQEIDLLEERNGSLFAYEIKLSKQKVKIPVAFKTAYPDSSFEIITRDSYGKFLTA